MPKLLKSICGKFWCLSSCKKSTSSLTSFLRYCKGTAKLLFWELWECLTTLIKNHRISLQETFMLICMQQINFITHLFLKILQRNSKLNILGNSSKPRYTLNDSINLKKSLMFICKRKTNFILSIFLEILQWYCKFVILGTLHKPAYAHLKWYQHLVELSYLSAGKRAILSPMFFYKYCKDMQTSYFEYFRHVWLYTPKMIKSTCRKFCCFSTSQK